MTDRTRMPQRPFAIRVVFAIVALVMVAALILAGCSERDYSREPVSGLSVQRAMLSEGYSLLYADARKIDSLNLALYVKAESQEFNDVITRIATYGDELKKSLERVARDYPGVRIDLTPLPEMEKRKRFAVGKSRLLEFAPLAGKSRLEYERTVLISLSNALNHERHLCQVMAAEEPDPGLKKFLLEAEQRYIVLHRLAVDLLDRQHYRHAAKS